MLIVSFLFSCLIIDVIFWVLLRLRLYNIGWLIVIILVLLVNVLNMCELWCILLLKIIGICLLMIFVIVGSMLNEDGLLFNWWLLWLEIYIFVVLVWIVILVFFGDWMFFMIIGRLEIWCI